MIKKRTLMALSMVSLLTLAGCGNTGVATDDNSSAAQTESEETKEDITIGTSPGPYSELFMDGIVPILEDQGYTVTETVFTEVRQVDVALQEGAIDVNVDQHLAYMNNFNKEANAELVAITPIPTVPTGIHSATKGSIDEVVDGDIIAIPDDASNTARALLVLQKAGWIKLDESIEPMASTKDNIIENPYNLEIVEMSSAQIPRSLSDVSYGVIPGSILYAAGLSSNDSLLNEDILPQLVLHAIVDSGNEETDWAEAIVEAYRSDEFKAHLNEVNTDNYWFIPDELK
ncbi:MetQ/NlpA family ABC transporter substrate-binding protein [Trichococcus shcherbakoviae]|uniref:MetQ/NlpA family ABC transporter substrate-binding protein n=1 Tax=Trichococcus shcherbakoviae TaxID=2094020 RepID=UPI000A3978B2|nr:MetQ/NlpA family ABC transporter substrate-binding protein [Trichococcus shcherbakoviae]